MSLLAPALGAALAAASVDPPSPGRDTFLECRQLVERQSFVAAAQKCAEAANEAPDEPDPHLFLGRAHAALSSPTLAASQGLAVPAVSEADAVAHRRLAEASLRRWLTASAAAPSDWQRRARPLGLSTLIALYLADPEAAADPALVGFAAELERTPGIPWHEQWLVATVYERNRRFPEAERALAAVIAQAPGSGACTQLAQLYLQPVWNGTSRFDDFVETFEKCVSAGPADPTGNFAMATQLWSKVDRDHSLEAARRADYLERGLRHVERALALDAEYLEAVVYKILLLRAKALATTDPASQKLLLDEAQAQSARAQRLRSAGVPLRQASERFVAVVAPPPAPPPPPRPSAAFPVTPPPAAPAATPVGALRVGGQIREPKKLVHVPPVYPEIAVTARVQGVVIIECTIGVDGSVVGTRIVRGIPLLDSAAEEAVRQWKFAPTLWDGVPVPVIMTVTVHFSLS